MLDHTLVTVDDSPEGRKFQALCDAKAGTRIYKTVDNVRGVFDQRSRYLCELCESGLMSDGYEFIEFEYPLDTPVDYFKGQNIGWSGLYRFTLEKWGHPQCELFNQRYDSLPQKSLESIDYYKKGVCIATWPIKEVSAKYKVKKIRTGPDGAMPGRFQSWHTIYASTDESSIYAENFRAKFIPQGATPGLGGGGTHPSVHCPELDNKGRYSPGVATIFRPARLANREVPGT